MRREWASAEEDSGAGQWVVLVGFRQMGSGMPICRGEL